MSIPEFSRAGGSARSALHRIAVHQLLTTQTEWQNLDCHAEQSEASLWHQYRRHRTRGWPFAFSAKAGDVQSSQNE